MAIARVDRISLLRSGRDEILSLHGASMLSESTASPHDHLGLVSATHVRGESACGDLSWE